MADFGSIDPATLALLNSANTFTQIQKIMIDNGIQMTFYRPINTNAFGAGFYYNFNNSSSTEVTYGNQYVSIEDNTATSHRGDFNVQLSIAASLGLRFRVFTSGNGGIIVGNNQRILVSETGLTAQRTFTFPDATTTVLGADTSQTVTTKAFNISNNTVTATSRATGDLVKDNGTKYERFGRGTAGQLLRTNLAGTDLEWVRGPAVTMSPIISGRKYASLSGTVSTPMQGTQSTVTAGATQGSTSANIDTTKGRYFTHTTGTVTGNNAGGRVTNLFQRAHNPYWSFRGRLASSYTASTLRTFFGVSSDAGADPGAVDTYGNTISLAMIGHRTTDTTFQFIHNDASATALYDNTGITVNATIHTWEIFGDDAGTRFGWAVDGGAINWVTTQVPATGTSLGIIHQIQTNDSGVAKAFDMIALYVEFDSK